AMFASGFFFLPGVAAGNAGPSVVLAYGVSAVLMVPAMYSIAELSSAMPRAGGAYFFIHRSLGPWFGVIGGVGLWLVLVLKSAFALVGMGAYIALFFDVPMVPFAVALTVAFGLLNTVGVKETAWLQNFLVFTLVPILAYYVVAGLFHVGGEGFGAVHDRQFTPFMPFGTLGFVSTVGLVSISYAGLTKIASAAEEIQDLDRNMPLGMLLALLTAAAIYVGGVYIMVASISPDALRGDLTPVATAGEVILGWLPGDLGLVLVVIAAIAAFASTGNAGILTASRYPLAMARDELVWSGFERISRFTTPTVAIWATCATMIAAIVFLDVERLAKLGSAFILLTFALINLAVIIMRESRIEAYAPGYRTPLYPWMQIAGIGAMLGLIATLGVFAVLFVVVIIVAATAWYRVYAKGRVARRGAIYTYFGRLSRLGESGVDHELWRLLQERGTTVEDSYEELVARARTTDITERVSIGEVIDRVVEHLSGDVELPPEELRDILMDALEGAIVPDGTAMAFVDVMLEGVEQPLAELVRITEGVYVGPGQQFPGEELDTATDVPTVRAQHVRGLIILITPEDAMTQHLRILAELVTQVEEPDFSRRWRRAQDEHELKEALLRHEWFVVVEVDADGPTRALDGRRIRDIEWPPNTLVALVRRNGHAIFPRGGTRLRDGDRMTVIGPPDEVEELFERYATSIRRR
ncbi:MAG: amino acid permease, partial [Nitriliruptorales bacterium]|nr:amino acid permease [Nitriliruptorales bacterium]